MSWLLVPAAFLIVALTFRLLYVLFRLIKENNANIKKYREAKEASERYSGEINRHLLKYIRKYSAVPDQKKDGALQRLAEIYGLKEEQSNTQN